MIMQRLLAGLSGDIETGRIADETDGFSGADLKMVVREAILISLTDGRTDITSDDLIAGENLIKARDASRTKNTV